MEQVFLSRRNLLTLLSKLDRKAAGETTACSIIKHDGQDPKFNQTIPIVMVTAVEDSDYYYNRKPDPVHTADVPKNDN